MAKIIVDERQQEELNMILNSIAISELHKVQRIMNVLNKSEPYEPDINKKDDG